MLPYTFLFMHCVDMSCRYKTRRGIAGSQDMLYLTVVDAAKLFSEVVVPAYSIICSLQESPLLQSFRDRRYPLSLNVRQSGSCVIVFCVFSLYFPNYWRSLLFIVHLDFSFVIFLWFIFKLGHLLAWWMLSKWILDRTK